MRKAIALVCLCMSLLPKLKAGDEKFQLTLLLSPTVEWVRFGQSINAPLYNQLWGSKLSYNFGFEYKRFFDPSLSISTGLMYMNKGFRNEILEDPTTNPNSDEPQIGVTLASMHIAAIPFYINAHHRLRRKVEMIYTAGIAGGWLFAERVRNNYYSGEETPQQGFLDTSPGAASVNLFVDYYVGAHIGVGISAYLKSRIVLVVQPMYKWQVNNARDFYGSFSSGDPFSARMNSFGIDLKIGYFFTKQIRNRKKEF
ncbi:MAG: hypothetical protein RLP15_05450 [Cryomorphaceae bacterium]